MIKDDASRNWTGHLPIVDDEVSDRKLMRIEEERRETKTKGRNPEVNQVRDG